MKKLFFTLIMVFSFFFLISCTNNKKEENNQIENESTTQKEDEAIITLELEGPKEVYDNEFNLQDYWVVFNDGSTKPTKKPLADYLTDKQVSELEKVGLHELEITIGKQVLKISINVLEFKTFDGYRFEDQTVTYDGKYHECKVRVFDSSIKVTYETENRFKNAGTYEVKAKLSKEGYPSITLTRTLKINQAHYDNETIRFANAHYIYDKTKTRSLELEGVWPSNFEVSYENNNQVNAGSYVVIAHLKDKEGNYQELTFEAELKIDKAVFDSSKLYFTNTVYTYDGTKKEATLVGEVPDDISYEIYYTRGSQINAGRTEITCIFESDNYEKIPNVTDYLIINKAQVTGLSLEDQEFDYDGKYHSAEFKGTLPEGMTPKFLFENRYISPGTYLIQLSFDNKNNNYETPDTLSAHLTINKIDFDYSVIVFEDQEYTYENLKSFSIEATNVPEGVYVGYENNYKSHAGVYTIRAICYVDPTIYKNPEKVLTATLTIKPKKVVAEIDGPDVLYPSKYDQSYLYEARCDDDIFNVLRFELEFSGELKGIGEYTITANLLNNDDNDYLYEPCVKTVKIVERIYKVTFRQEGQEDIVVDVVEGGTIENVPTPVEVPGYEFTWDRSDFTNIHEAYTITAIKTLKKYKITYHEDEFGLYDDPQTVSYFTIEDNFVFDNPRYGEGHQFAGYYLTPDYQENTLISSIKPKTIYEDIDVYGKAYHYVLTSWEGLNYNYTNGKHYLGKTIDYQTKTYDLLSEIKYAKGSIIKIRKATSVNYLDNYVVDLVNGANIFYIEVYDETETHYTSYELSLIKQASGAYCFVVDGKVVVDKVVGDGERVDLPAVSEVQRPGYKFIGFKFGNIYFEDYFVAGGEKMTIVFEYELIQYTLTYHDSYHGNSSFTFTFKDIKYLKKNKLSGYDFAGWNTEPDFTGEYLTRIEKNTFHDVDVYAHFTPKTFKINYLVDDETVVDSSNPTTRVYKEKDIKLKGATKKGYVFRYWKNKLNGYRVNTILKDYNGDLDLIPKFDPISYYFTYELNGGTLPDPVRTYTVDRDVVLRGATKEGYDFDTWCYDKELQNPVIDNTFYKGAHYGDITLYARYKEKEITINLDLAGGTGETTGKAVYLSNYTLPIPKKLGYEFAGWYYNDVKYTNELGESLAIYEHKDTVTLTAHYTPIRYLVCFDAGVGSGEMEDIYLTYDLAQALPKATVDCPGSVFSHWTYNGQSYSDEEVVKNLTGNKDEIVTLTANYTGIEYTISLYSRDYTFYSVDVTYMINDQVYKKQTVHAFDTLRAPSPVQMYGRFAGWYDNRELRGEPFDFEQPLTKDVTLYAYFESSSFGAQKEIHNKIDEVFSVYERTNYTYGFYGFDDQYIKIHFMQDIDQPLTIRIFDHTMGGRSCVKDGKVRGEYDYIDFNLTVEKNHYYTIEVDASRYIRDTVSYHITTTLSYLQPNIKVESYQTATVRFGEDYRLPVPLGNPYFRGYLFNGTYVTDSRGFSLQPWYIVPDENGVILKDY